MDASFVRFETYHKYEDPEAAPYAVSKRLTLLARSQPRLNEGPTDGRGPNRSINSERLETPNLR